MRTIVLVITVTIVALWLFGTVLAVEGEVEPTCPSNSVQTGVNKSGDLICQPEPKGCQWAQQVEPGEYCDSLDPGWESGVQEESKTENSTKSEQIIDPYAK